MSPVLMDFDGTLFRLPVEFDALRAELGLGEGERLGDALQRYLDEGDTARLDTVTRHECAAVAAGEFLPGAIALLTALRGAPAGVVTRNSRHAVLAALAMPGLPELPDLVVVGREDVRRLKPDPEAIFVALTGLGLPAGDAARAVLVGDTFHDVQAAHAAGARSVIVHNPLLARTPADADLYVDALDALVGPGRPVPAAAPGVTA